MKTKITLFMILIILFTIFVTQNAKVIIINVFFWQFPMSAVVLISVSGFVGLLLGFLLSKIFSYQSKKKDDKVSEIKATEPNKEETDKKTDS
ncbi:MAG TPA: DUF1049 domain-containing protein [Ignavibacteria bacterium]|nr:DUF1049 domain-containing protein [Ignavibacteria bacterium]